MNTSIEYAINHPSHVMCKLRKTNHSKLLDGILSKNIAGDILEIGSYTGEGSTMVIASVMHHYATNKTLHIFDSFQGLSQPNALDHSDLHTKNLHGMFKSPKNILEKNIANYNINVEIYPGWINDTLTSAMPNRICYAHIDCDLYEPILYALQSIYNNLTSGAVCIIDDYNWPWLPGATKAVDEFISNKSEKLHLLPNTIHAYFIKN